MSLLEGTKTQTFGILACKDKNETENIMIQRMIRSVRKWNNRCGGWPGKPLNAPAATLYPNILAEIDASGMYLWCPAMHARVSPEIMAAVLEDAEDLTLGELRGLCSLYERAPEYMAESTLRIIDPTTNEGREKRCEMEDMLKQANGLDFSLRFLVEDVLFAMDNGKPVTDAAYRKAATELFEVLNPKRKPLRERRLDLSAF